MASKRVAADLAAALDKLVETLLGFADDPLGFVLWAFPWGEPDGPLWDEHGPDEWQREQLDEIGYRIRKDPFVKITDATVSGHGIGKSCEVAWIILWAQMTAFGTRGRITANSDTQLKSTTWAEVAKWFSMMDPMVRDLFEYAAESLHVRAADAEKKAQWRIQAIPNSKTNPAAFAGLHNARKRVLIIFDEASEIPDIIWDTALGATTDKETQVIFLAFGNPTQNTGRFKEVVDGRFRTGWTSRKIDSRTVSRTDKALLQTWVDAWGEDSDFVRIRVRGEFPRQGSMQLIPADRVAEARKRPPGYISSDPLVGGLDVARYGDDASVLAFRKGRDAVTIPWKRWRQVDTMTLASDVAMQINLYGLDALFVDIGGVGGGVYDRLVALQSSGMVLHSCVLIPVNFGEKGMEVSFNGVSVRTANWRAAMWTAMSEWLKLGSVPDEKDVEADLIGVTYKFNGDNAILLESKEDMKKRGLASPDNGDALGLTFAVPIAPKSQPTPQALLERQSAVRGDYDPHRDLQ